MSCWIWTKRHPQTPPASRLSGQTKHNMQRLAFLRFKTDPTALQVKVGTLTNGEYQFNTSFTGEAAIVSHTFPGLNLTHLQILEQESRM
jgi:hypothetical protein